MSNNRLHLPIASVTSCADARSAPNDLQVKVTLGCTHMNRVRPERRKYRES